MVRPNARLPRFYTFDHNYIIQKESRNCVCGFIEDIWNKGLFEIYKNYLHPEFIDYSLPKGKQTSDDLIAYLSRLNTMTQHHTSIESMIIENDFAILKIKISLIGLDCGTASHLDHPEPQTISGSRVLSLCDQRIIGHWEFFDLSNAMP